MARKCGATNRWRRSDAVKRRLIIGSALAMVVGVVLICALWTEDEPPVISIAYESVSKRDAGQVWFQIHTTVSNPAISRVYELQKTSGGWQSVAGSELRHIYIREPCTFGLLRTVPKGDPHWRMVLEYHPNPGPTAPGRIRHRVYIFALQKRWSNLAGWLDPMKPEILYGPEMLGNKPVEKP
jgi:hypothetical protein